MRPTWRRKVTDHGRDNALHDPTCSMHPLKLTPYIRCRRN